MKNNFKLLGIIVVVAVIGFSMTGCASSTSTVNPGWDPQLMLPDGVYVRDYTILGVVQVEERRTVLLGGFLPALPLGAGGGSVHLMQTTRGQATYAALLAEARRRFPNANAVIGVQIDRVHSNFFIFTASRTYILTGLAVQFAAEPPPRYKQVARLEEFTPY